MSKPQTPLADQLRKITAKCDPSNATQALLAEALEAIAQVTEPEPVEDDGAE